jgi:YggT family protein
MSIDRRDAGPDPDDVDERAAPVVPSAGTEVTTTFSPARRAYEVIYLLFAVIDGLILIRIILKALGANIAAPFTGFVYGVTVPLLAPFHNLLPTLVNGKSVFELSALVAFIVYALLGIVLARLVALMFTRNVRVSQSSGPQAYRRPRAD